MTSLQNKRLSAGISAIAQAAILIANYMLSGHSGINAIRDSVTLCLLLCLFCGSEIARWIIGILSCLGVVIGLGGITWIALQADGRGLMIGPQRAPTLFIFIALVAIGFVAYRLIFWRPPENTEVDTQK